MRTIPGFQKFLIALVVLALAQFACSISGQAPSSTPPPVPTSAPQATQPPVETQATQPPTSGTAVAHGSVDDAKAMLQKAVAHYNSVGRTQALADFTNRVAPFFDRDLYVACIDSTLVQSANGGFPDLVGSAIQPLSRSDWDSATTNAVSSISYAWIDPATGVTEPKTFFYEKVGSDVCGVGAYNP